MVGVSRNVGAQLFGILGIAGNESITSSDFAGGTASNSPAPHAVESAPTLLPMVDGCPARARGWVMDNEIFIYIELSKWYEPIVNEICMV